MEAGLFGGGFISNYFHQFYEYEKFPDGNRPLLGRVSPELGLRYAYFFHPYIGAEAELSMIMASTQGMDLAGTGSSQSAKIYNFRVQAIFQYPLPDLKLYPFVAVGIGPMHTSSDYLGSDTDWPLHVGAGARFYVTPSIAVRADLRFLRGPSLQDPYTLNASYGEFMVGVSWIPHASTQGPDVEHQDDQVPVVDKDSDGDGIPDSKDKCPNEPEDKDLFDDSDGCPDPDNDGDGIPDEKDKCPLEAEDKDNFQDDDGCPDLDNDGDGIPDAADKCPDQPETKNGFEDEDGCPDEVPEKLKQFTGAIQGINFKTGAADLAGSTAVLDKAIAVLTEFKDIKLEIQGHTDDVPLKSKAFTDNLALSQARAETVKAYFVKKGIDEARLTAKGYGDTVPLTDPKDLKAGALNAARAKNRRVEFKLVSSLPETPAKAPEKTEAPAPEKAPEKK